MYACVRVRACVRSCAHMSLCAWPRVACVHACAYICACVCLHFQIKEMAKQRKADVLRSSQEIENATLEEMKARHAAEQQVRAFFPVKNVACCTPEVGPRHAAEEQVRNFFPVQGVASCTDEMGARHAVEEQEEGLFAYKIPDAAS